MRAYDEFDSAGIVNGSGSVGSIVQGLLTPTLLSLYGYVPVASKGWVLCDPYHLLSNN